MKLICHVISLTVLLLLACSRTAAQESGVRCYGTVIDSLTKKPLPGAVVTEITGRDDQLVVRNYVTDKTDKLYYIYY